MRTTINLSDDAMLTAQSYARRSRISLGEAVSRLIRESSALKISSAASAPLIGRYALAALRDEVITPEHVRELMQREGM